MEFARVHNGNPEQVFITVRNVDSSTMSSGRAAMWNLPFISTGSAGAGNEGYAVTFACTSTTGSATAAPHLGAFAGVVAPYDIPSGEFGRIQVYGPISSVLIHGTTGAPFQGWAGYTDMTSVSRLLLKPFHQFAWNTVVTQPGIFGVMTAGTTADTTLRPFLAGGYAFPYSDAYTSVSTDGSWILNSGGLGTTGTGWCKAFLRCL